METNNHIPLPHDAYAVALEFAVLPIDVIVVDRSVHPRNQLDERYVKAFVRVIADGDPLPPPIVFRNGNVFLLADGFLRVEAHRNSGSSTIKCGILPGSRREATEYAISINAHHGRKLTIAERRRAVNTLLDEPDNDTLSDHDLGRVYGCSHTTVARLRKMHPLSSTFGSDGVRSFQNKHGTRSLMQTRRIGRRNGAATEVEAASSSTGSVQPAAAAPGQQEAGPPAFTSEPPAQRGSVQLRSLLAALRHGKTVEEAAPLVGMSVAEASLHFEAEQAGEYAHIVLLPDSIARSSDVSEPPPSRDPGATPSCPRRCEDEPYEVILERLEACLPSDPVRFGHALGASRNPAVERRFRTCFDCFTAVVDAFSERRNAFQSTEEGTGDDR